jgi:biotin carboxyl carrier protein
MTKTDSEAFARAKAQIERNVAEVAELARDGRLAPGVFFERFLKLAVESLDAMGGAVWEVKDRHLSLVAELSLASSDFGAEPQREWIDRLLTQAATGGRSLVVAASERPAEEGAEIGNNTPYPFFYVPAVLDGRVAIVLQIWLKQAGDPRSYRDLVVFLENLVQQACLYLRGAEHGLLLKRERFLQGFSSLQAALLGELSPKILCTTTANFAVDLVPCHLAATFRRRGKTWELLAASNQELIDTRADQSRVLAALAAVLPTAPEGRSWHSGVEDAVDPVIGEELSKAGFSGVAWIHTKASKKSDPAILLAALWHEPPADFEKSVRNLCLCAAPLEKALDSASMHDSIPFRRALSGVSRVRRAWGDGRRTRVVLWGVLPALVLAAVLLFPVPLKIKAKCSLLPARVASVVAETDGKIVEILAPEGTRVEAGSELARLEDADYTTQLEVARQQQARWQVESARAHALGQEAERKVAELSSKREQANIVRLEFLRSRTRLRSPMEGIVLTRGVQHRDGEAIKTGELFCEVGSAEDFVVQLDLRQQDVGLLLAALESGAALPVDFLLAAQPRHRQRAHLASSDAISQLPEMRENETVFTARLPFHPVGMDVKDIKAGYTGNATIVVGRGPAAWVWSRPFRQYWRMHWGL